MNYMGIDHHKQYSHITLLDESGDALKSGRVTNLRRELENFLCGVEKVKAVVEAGRSSYTMVDVLEDLGIATTVAHPKEVKAIAKAKVKTDERDSYKLAHLLRTGYIPEVYKRSRENRSSQRVLRQRAFYVGKQTAVKNRLRALLAQQGEEIRGEASRVENLFTLKGMRMLEGLALPEREAKMVGALLKTFRHLQERIDETNTLVDELYKKMPSAQLVQTVPGFGKFLSVLVAVEIEDIGRFEGVGKFHAYAGVIPSTHSSSDRTYHGKIVKEGNRWLRWATVEAVWPSLRADFDLKCYYERMKKRKGANSAKVATARRLLTIIFRMLKEGRPYIPYKR
jgi:transposase